MNFIKVYFEGLAAKVADRAAKSAAEAASVAAATAAREETRLVLTQTLETLALRQAVSQEAGRAAQSVLEAIQEEAVAFLSANHTSTQSVIAQMKQDAAALQSEAEETADEMNESYVQLLQIIQGVIVRVVAATERVERAVLEMEEQARYDDEGQDEPDEVPAPPRIQRQAVSKKNPLDLTEAELREMVLQAR